MNSQQSNKKRQILFLILQFILVLLCVSYIYHIYYKNILPDKIVRETYHETKCTIENKQITSMGKMISRYRADFLVNYLVNGQEYTSWVSANGLDQSFTRDRKSQEDALEQFNVGETYSCWYNPLIPQLSVLVIRHDWTTTFPLLIPAIILIIIIYFIVRTSSHLRNKK